MKFFSFLLTSPWFKWSILSLIHFIYLCLFFLFWLLFSLITSRITFSRKCVSKLWLWQAPYISGTILLSIKSWMTDVCAVKSKRSCEESLIYTNSVWQFYCCSNVACIMLSLMRLCSSPDAWPQLLFRIIFFLCLLGVCLFVMCVCVLGVFFCNFNLC